MPVHGGAQVTFIESFAQPRGDGDSFENSTASNVTQQLRPSLVIAGDAKALESVRTVHSPKSAVSPKSLATPTQQRFSFSEGIGEASHAATVVVGASDEGGSRWWRLQLVDQSLWKGRADFVGSAAALVVTSLIYGRFQRWYEDRPEIDGFAARSDPVLPYLGFSLSTPLLLLVWGSMVAGCAYGSDKSVMLLEFLQTSTLVLWVRMAALYLTRLEAPQDATPLAHALLVFLVCRRAHWRWKALFFALALATVDLAVVQKPQYTTGAFATALVVYASHGVVQGLRRRVCSSLFVGDEVVGEAHGKAKTN